jgi:hypothetical protein
MIHTQSWIHFKGAIQQQNGRMNREIVDREKTMRGLKVDETAILQGCQLIQFVLDLTKALNGKSLRK